MNSNLNLNTHEAVIYLLTREGRGMTSLELATMIQDEDLCRDARGNHPTATEISRRVSGSTYKDAFTRKDGMIYHSPVADKRLMRLTYNTERWAKPIPHKWDKKNRDTKMAFENQWGFGFEEWLMDPGFFQDGYQYGLVRGGEDVKNLYRSIRETYLFTINQKTKERFVVGILYNMELISVFSPVCEIARSIFHRNIPMMRTQLKSTGADDDGLKMLDYPAVRFQPEDLILFDKMIPAEELSNDSFMRFLPYKVEGSLESYLSNYKPKDQFRFKKGRAKRGGSTTRTILAGTGEVSDLHAQIIDELELLLESPDSPLRGNSEIETCRFDTHKADIVIEHEDLSYTIIEVKTSDNLRRNIRDALGQLIDYAFWYPDLNVQKLIIVSPERMRKREQEYFKRVQAALDIKLEYWHYDQELNQINYEGNKM